MKILFVIIFVIAVWVWTFFMCKAAGKGEK